LQPLSSRVDSWLYQGNHEPPRGGEALTGAEWHWLAVALHPGAARVLRVLGKKRPEHRFCACENEARDDHALLREVSESRDTTKNSIKSMNGTGVQIHCRSMPPRRSCHIAKIPCSIGQDVRRIGTCIDHRPKQAARRSRCTAA